MTQFNLIQNICNIHILMLIYFSGNFVWRYIILFIKLYSLTNHDCFKCWWLLKFITTFKQILNKKEICKYLWWCQNSQPNCVCVKGHVSARLHHKRCQYFWKTGIVYLIRYSQKFCKSGTSGISLRELPCILYAHLSSFQLTHLWLITPWRWTLL